jgi:hypothetical protein
MIFTIYKLPNYVYRSGLIGKIGCSNNISGRLTKYNSNQLKDYEILEEHTDIYLASDREQQLQKENGYRVDRVPYHKTFNIAQPAGLKGGKSAIDTGQLDTARKTAHDKCNHSKYICPYCNKEGQYRAMKRWHGENCSQNK